MKRLGLLAASAVMLSGLMMFPVHAEETQTVIHNGWRKAYENLLTEYAQSEDFQDGGAETSGAMWDLYDIDGDGVPELFLSPSDAYTARCQVYAFSEKSEEAVEIGTTGMFGTAAACQAECLLRSDFLYQGQRSTRYYHFANGKLTLQDSFSDNASAFVEADASGILYQHGDQTISCEEYEVFLSPYTAMHWTEGIGREYDFTQLSLFQGDIPPAPEPVILSPSAVAPPDYQTAMIFGGIAALVVAVFSAAVSLGWRSRGNS